jgi:hypothetical protein
MKLQRTSDLNFEFLLGMFPGERLISSAHEADVLALTGDMSNGPLVIELFKNWPMPVL